MTRRSAAFVERAGAPTRRRVLGGGEPRASARGGPQCWARVAVDLGLPRGSSTLSGPAYDGAVGLCHVVAGSLCTFCPWALASWDHPELRPSWVI